MDKQIEEMAKVLDNASCHGYECENCFFDDIVVTKQSCVCVKALYNAGYRKIPEGAVVLTREEYDELQIGKDFNYGYHCGQDDMTLYYENIRLPEVRKETAEKFARGFINDILPKIMNGHNEKALQIAMAMTNYCKEITEGV